MFLACVTDGTRPKMFLMVIEAFFFFFFFVKEKTWQSLGSVELL